MAVPAKARSSKLYEQDLYAWSQAQADLLRRRRFAELDLEHVVEEIEDVGGSLYREVRSRIRTIIEHLLKLEHAAATEPRAGGERTILAQRADLAADLTPSLRPRIGRNLARFYEVARIEAAVALRAHRERAAADALPTTCPYSLDQIPGDCCRTRSAGRKRRKVPDAFLLPIAARLTEQPPHYRELTDTKGQETREARPGDRRRRQPQPSHIVDIRTENGRGDNHSGRSGPHDGKGGRMPGVETVSRFRRCHPILSAQQKARGKSGNVR